MSNSFETVVDIAMSATAASSVQEAVNTLDAEQGWAELTEMMNDSRLFIIDRKFSQVEIENTLRSYYTQTEG